MSASPPAGAPPGSVADGDPLEHPADRWRTGGVALLAVWATLLVVAVVLWVRLAFFPGRTDEPRGYLILLGAPFALLALGLLWWAWRSVRALRRGRREGWTLLLVLGGVAVVQSVMTAPGVLASSGGTGTPGVGDPTGPPREVIAGLLAVIGLGLLSIVVAVLGRRIRPVDAAAD